MTTDKRTDRSAAEHLRAQAHKVAQDLQEMGSIAGDVAQENIAQVRDSASEYSQQGRDEINKAEHLFETFIRDRPFQSVLIAAGVGWFLGRSWRRR